jgi:hypothetical protein
MMNKIFLGRGLGAFFVLLTSSQTLYAAPACKGPNKNDPSCPGTEPAAAPALAVVDSVTVDWLNQWLAIRGTGFTDQTQFTLGGSAQWTSTELSVNSDGTEVLLPFNPKRSSCSLPEAG